MGLQSLRSFIPLQTVLFLCLVTIAFHPTPAVAQSYCGPVTKVNFTGLLAPQNGGYPTGHLAADGQGNVYGTTNGGQVQGAGTIWKYSPSSGLTTLFFSGPIYVYTSGNGSVVGAAVGSGVSLDSQGNLWSSTLGGGIGFQNGGNAGNGTLYELTAAGSFTTLEQFDGTNGEAPGPLVFDSHGNLWGVTSLGGANNSGTLFEYSPATGGLTNPVSFPATGYSMPAGPVVFDSQGNLYGVDSGGSSGMGAIWEYSAAGVLTTIFNFTGLNGYDPNGGLILDGKGNLYGTTSLGGASYAPPINGYGTVWKYNLATGVLTTLVSFTASGTTGQQPMSGVLLDANGNLYGTTNSGGTSGYGAVWEYSSAGVLTDLVTFSGPNGQNPQATLVFDSTGNLWGTTSEGGSYGYGTAFELTPNTGGGCGPALSSLTFNPSSIPNGETTTATVTLSAAAPSGGSVVELSDDNASVLNVPSSVAVPAGATTATFPATAKNLFVLSNTVVTVTATLGNSTAQGTATVTPGINVTSIRLNPSTVTGGNSSTGTVTIASPAPSGGNEVELSQSQNSHFCVLPLIYPNNNPIVTVPPGSTSVSFPLGTTSTTTSCTAPLYAQSGTTTVSTNFTVNPGGSSGPTLSSLTLNPTSVTGGGSSQGTVTLSGRAPSGGSVVSLSSNSGSASVPGSVTVASGNTIATFTVSTQTVTSNTSAVITGTLGSSSQQATLTITPAGSVTLSSLTLNPTSVSGGNSSTGTVTLSSSAPSGGLVVTLSSSNTSVATVPSSVTVAAGSTSASFTVRTQSVSSNTNVVISAVYAGTTKNATLTVTGRHH